jgi:MFS family permease
LDEAPRPLRRHAAFMRFWWGRLAGTTANQMLMVAVGWQMYGLTGSAWDLGLVGLLQFLPALALVLVAGHVADRFERRRVLALCMAVQAVIAAVLVLATLQGWADRRLLLALSVAIGAAKAFQMPAQQAIVRCWCRGGAAARARLQLGRHAARDHRRAGARRLPVRGRHRRGLRRLRAGLRHRVRAVRHAAPRRRRCWPRSR